MTQLVTVTTAQAPAPIAAAGDRAAYRFLESFTAQIRNPHTRRAYVRAVGGSAPGSKPAVCPRLPP